jgi:hypothetical protein
VCYPTVARVFGLSCVYLIFWDISFEESIVLTLYLVDNVNVYAIIIVLCIS